MLNKELDNLKLTTPEDIIISISISRINFITEELGDNSLSILVIGSRNVYAKEQMTIVLHYVNERD